MKVPWFLLLSVLFFISCDSAKEEAPTAGNSKEEIYIWLQHQTGIYANTAKDSVIVFQKEKTADTASNYNLSRFKSLHSAALSDSISFYANAMIRDTAREDSYVTCNAGDYFSIEIKRGAISYSVRFKSVNDWKNCSDKTRTFAHFLKQNNLLPAQ